MMTGRLSGKVALVTGASRGLGRRLCEALVAEGARVGMVARGADDLAQAAVPFGSQALTLPTDITQPDAVRAAFAALKQRFGGVDILVNNAALGHPQKIAEADDRLLQLEVAANLLGPIYCVREAVASMRTRGGGDIVNISSESARLPYPFLSLYAATKSALETLSDGLREELRGDRIRVGVLRSGRLAESSFPPKRASATGTRRAPMASTRHRGSPSRRRSPRAPCST
jgi:NAD(P)-dependent dehydrogenase (short-subunit alcohol dehydrogenase family)